ncbi:MAG: winged helix DNA-binding domain-containing protein [Oscillospiraceae bacterium]|nr:winged helix DNA-binding domain-containing protein [Oscillospiraceae bacterium]
MLTLTNAQARRYLLRRHGLIGGHRFEGKAGTLAYVRQCGCIQFDPIDVCGQNAELVLQSRVKGFQKYYLAELLYADRALVDYFDKNLSIWPVEDWPYFAPLRAMHQVRGYSREAVDMAADAVRKLLKERPFVCARDLGMEEKVHWAWANTTLSRAILETLYFRGELCIHHKKGTNKQYAPAERLLPPELLAAPDPYSGDEAAHRAWRVARRIGAVGLLWNRPSDAWLGIGGMQRAGRDAAFEALLSEGRILPVQVEGFTEPLYAPADAVTLLEEAASGTTYAPRAELIAALDCLLWDRKLIRQLFDFSYSWEIYTPKEARRYGYYVLPLLIGERFAGRVEALPDAKAGVLRVKGIWWEGRPAPAALAKCMQRFANFHGCEAVEGLP